MTEGNSGTSSELHGHAHRRRLGREVTVQLRDRQRHGDAAVRLHAEVGHAPSPRVRRPRPVSVDVNGDTDHEPNETFDVNLTNPSNASIADNKGVGTITNDDPDVTAPNTFITSGPSGNTDSTSAALTFASNESGSTFECGKITGSGEVTSFSSCSSPSTSRGSPRARDKFAVKATDAAGNTDPSAATRTWTVVAGDPGPDGSEGTVPPGATGTVSSDPAGAGPTASDPVTTAVELPDGGTVTIEEQPVTTPAPQGFTMVDQEVVIEAPPASPAAPLKLTFTLDGSKLVGLDRSTLTVLRERRTGAQLRCRRDHAESDQRTSASSAAATSAATRPVTSRSRC